MDVPVQRIVQHLQQLIDHHDLLLDLAERKSDVLVRNQVDELTRIMSQESKLAKQIAASEQAYVEAASELFRKKGIEPSASVTMSELIKLIFDPADKRALTEARDGLLARVERLQQMNARNQKLIEMSLAYINFTLDLMTGEDQEAVYRNPADAQSDAKSGKKGRNVFEAKA